MSVRPRVLLVNYEFPPIGGGAGTATAGMARALAELGCDAVVLTSRFRDQPAHEQRDGYTIRRVRVVRRHADRCTPAEMVTFMVSAAVAAVRLTRHWRPQLTIAFFGIPGGPVAWLLRRVRGTPYIVSLRGGDVPGFDCAPRISLYHRAATPVLRFLWPRARAVVANGSGLRDLALRVSPDLAVQTIPNGVDAPRTLPPAAANEPPRVLFVGRLAYQKAADVLIRALSRIRDQDFTCDIVGDGPDRSELERLTGSLGLRERVRFVGWVDRNALAQHYARADLVALPSRMEGMPNVVLEAMAHERPVIATDVPGTRDVVAPEETGLLVPPDDDAALAHAIARLLGDSPLRQRMGAAGRARVLAQFTWPAAARAYLQLGGIDSATTDASIPVARTAGAG